MFRAAGVSQTVELPTEKLFEQTKGNQKECHSWNVAKQRRLAPGSQNVDDTEEFLPLADRSRVLHRLFARDSLRGRRAHGYRITLCIFPRRAGKYKAGDLAPGQETVCECPRIFSIPWKRRARGEGGLAKGRERETG